MGKSTTSVRLDDELRRRLADMAFREGTSLTELIERYLREGLACAAHPGIVFRDGPAGRRAALADGPDVWEIVAALPRHTGTEAARVASLAEESGLSQHQIVVAIEYAAANRAEIEAWIESNERALVEAERVAGERKRLLG
jgi:hypothetical protein